VIRYAWSVTGQHLHDIAPVGVAEASG